MKHGEVPGPLVGGPKPLAVRTRRRPSRLRRVLHVVTAPIVVVVIRLLWASYRYRVTGEQPLREPVAAGEPLILTFWHDSIFAMAWYLARMGRRGARITFLVSPSADGDFAVRVLEIMGSRAVRGSATRSGVKAMAGLYRAITREGGSPVVLPDGPHGPRRSCKPGSLLLAQMSGARILPMACAARRSWHLPTWDRLLVPVPTSRVEIVLGEAYEAPAGMSPERLEEERVRLERRLSELNGEARRLAGG